LRSGDNKRGKSWMDGKTKKERKIVEWGRLNGKGRGKLIGKYCVCKRGKLLNVKDCLKGKERKIRGRV
jgi:hypothetical protein